MHTVKHEHAFLTQKYNGTLVLENKSTSVQPFEFPSMSFCVAERNPNVKACAVRSICPGVARAVVTTFSASQGFSSPIIGAASSWLVVSGTRMGTGISEASKRIPIFSFATQGGKQVSSYFGLSQGQELRQVGLNRLRFGSLLHGLSLKG